MRAALTPRPNKKIRNVKNKFKAILHPKGIEALARDNLKMVGEDEVLVIIKQPQILQTPQKSQ
ncbi:MAG: hypothetical protein MZV70_76345 [Desulfobacterales bacterium]|nr:hypothetical protein [Desulfobacterales bacterium]